MYCATLATALSTKGEFHESMNLASLWKLPMIFFVENNLYGMGAPVDETLVFHDEIYKFARSYKMPSQRVDGMDVMKVLEATREAVEAVRGGGGPYFIEAMAYRFPRAFNGRPLGVQGKD